MQPPRRLLFFGTLLLAVSLPAAVYQWIDQQGQVHYGDRPPGPTAKSLQVKPAAGPPQPTPSENARRQARQRLLEVYREEREQKQTAAQRRRRQRAESKENCLQARRRYARFNGAGGIYVKNPEGEREYLDRAARERYLQGLQKELERWCGRD